MIILLGIYTTQSRYSRYVLGIGTRSTYSIWNWNLGLELKVFIQNLNLPNEFSQSYLDLVVRHV